ncbi:TRAP transporter substrate-binding protein [Acuticoccus sp. I52.16.1]|uniref:TRAP transporter substrate-binding protein n=1 Tax=Acuticoccus sp. I52.16.1 TaxID=2928472 RepID=UPI001FD1C973|nr:TRAP transporter substrate-binding protein [Acuticoccus sp. I52.16.1]UOM35196.1 TRAP transporter substrate-binding protein [Acuticoccus sp. I52.16.1]
MKRRDFLAGAAGATIAAGTLATPHVAKAQSTFSWKMTNAYGPGSPYYVEGPGSPTDFCRKVAALSGGRLTIQHFAAGELIPALEGFDAVQNGVVEMNAANAYFWAGKIPAAQYFTTVPFGMDVKGTNAWMYHGDGIKLWHEMYEPLGLIAFPMGNTGVQMTGWFRKEITSVADFDGLKMRIPGLAGKVYAKLGVNVQLLPGGEIFPALERGVIDAAEFVGPYQDRRLGLQKAAKYYYTTGWHEPNNVTELLINKAAWDSLPEDLQTIVTSVAAECNLVSNAWCDATNAEAMVDLVENFGTIAQPLPDDVVAELKTLTEETLAEGAAADPQTQTVHDNYFAFKKQYAAWANQSLQPLLPLLYS